LLSPHQFLVATQAQFRKQEVNKRFS